MRSAFEKIKIVNSRPTIPESSWNQDIIAASAVAANGKIPILDQACVYRCNIYPYKTKPG